MNFTAGYLQSSVGKKLIMAISGIILIGFILGHLIGNLQVFSGPEKFNNYAKFLQSLGGLLWVARIFLLGTLLAHIISAVALTKENKAARPIGYQNENTNVASWSSRTMVISGMVIAAFVIYHLLHFTIVVADPELIPLKDNHDIFSMVVIGFQKPIVAASYIVAVGLLCFHLNHAIFSVFQTLGINSSSMDKKIKLFSTALSTLIFLGYASIPVSILLNIVKPQGGM
ncbi:MAG: succinate dehydrogenase cytochrome b subunit [Leptospiraceae bacterium]|nr:succinate dehydrogenase cytochrome b subunit [Leptospiraceae bacterium]MCP5496535.1 succinate dehydrogenase cytochrome b subunit [Leptospiraceae bacterium]